MKPIRIALTKGRLEKDSIAMFERLGYDCTAVREKGRRLILPVANANMEVVLAKAAEVATYVVNGVCDIAAPEGVDFYAGYHTRCVASKYVNVARAFFERKNMDVNFVKIEGSVELAPILGLSDAIVDIVETGATLRENGLVVAEYITDVSARLIVNIASLKLRKAEIEPFISEIEQYLAGEDDA